MCKSLRFKRSAYGKIKVGSLRIRGMAQIRQECIVCRYNMRETRVMSTFGFGHYNYTRNSPVVAGPWPRVRGAFSHTK